MQADILSEIKKIKNIRDVVVLTHNIDFIFLQTVLLATLKRCGQPSLTVFADAHCTQESFARQANMINGLGSRYRVIPVAMNPGFRFHPKAILLSGDAESYLYTGSGNLTFGGLRENGEVWNKYEGNEGVIPAEFSSMKQYLSAILPYVGLSDEVEKDIADVFHEDRHSWVKALPPASGLWFQPGFGESLLQRMKNKLIGRRVRSIRVCAPYFDTKAKALNELSASFGDPPVEVYIQSKRSTLLQTAANSLSNNIAIKSLQIKLGDEPSNRFVHAKWYAFDMGDGIELFSGSANCSNAALLLSGDQGNAELMAESTMSYRAFSDGILSELIINDDAPDLIDEIDESEVDELEEHCLTISSARYDYGQLVVAYRASKKTVVMSVVIDDELTAGSITDNRVQCIVDSRPKRVMLMGEGDGKQVSSNAMWVDDESLLRSSATSRQVIDAIQHVQKVGENDPRRWIMLFDLLSQNFQHRSSRETPKVAAKDSGETGQVTLHKDFLVSKEYNHGLSLPLVNLNGTNQSQSIYSLLLSSFGLNGQDPVEEKLVDENTDGDQPEKTPSSLKPEKRSKEINPSKRQRSRLLELVASIIDEICQSDLVLVREPELLSRDLQVVAILLRKLYSMGWIDETEFLYQTHKTWSQLFFSTKNDRAKGLMQIRFEASSDPQKFIDQLVTPSLVAAIYSWFSAVSVRKIDVYAYRFMLSQLMAMGRCPWLWNLNDENQQQVVKQLYRIWTDSPGLYGNGIPLSDQMRHFIKLVESLSKQGLALTSFEHEMAAYDLNFILDTINDRSVNKGDIIWQGGAGLCVTLEDSQDKDRLDVLSLQKPERKSTFFTDKIVPLKSVLAKTVLFSDSFLNEHKHLLDQFIGEYDLANLDS